MGFLLSGVDGSVNVGSWLYIQSVSMSIRIHWNDAFLCSSIPNPMNPMPWPKASQCTLSMLYDNHIIIAHCSLSYLNPTLTILPLTPCNPFSRTTCSESTTLQHFPQNPHQRPILQRRRHPLLIPQLPIHLLRRTMRPLLDPHIHPEPRR